MRVIGLMSGTSLDGIDAAVIELDAAANPTLIGHHHRPYSAVLAKRLRATQADAPLRSVLTLDAELAGEYAAAVNALLEKTNLDHTAIAAIGLHGQTIWHDPQSTPPVTCQIGDPSRLAEATGISVVADFRQRDLAAGGEGAPFAPFFHARLFAGDSERVVVNLGGIANISLISAQGKPVGGFDCGPANILLDAWTRQHTDKSYDIDGAWAATGSVDMALLERLLDDPYFKRPPPKSTGPEYFNLGWLTTRLTGEERTEDVQATLAELTARSLAQAIQQWGGEAREIILCGGGVENPHLRDRIERALPEHAVSIADDWGWPAATIEAVGFACLAYATLQGEGIDLTPITGARHAVVMGGIYPA